MITDNDIKKIKSFLRTKQEADKDKKDLKKDILGVKEALTIEVIKTRSDFDSKINSLETKFDNKFDNVMTKLDAVYGEVIAIRQEESIHSQIHEDITNRLIAVETIPSIAHELKRK